MERAFVISSHRVAALFQLTAGSFPTAARPPSSSFLLLFPLFIYKTKPPAGAAWKNIYIKSQETNITWGEQKVFFFCALRPPRAELCTRTRAVMLLPSASFTAGRLYAEPGRLSPRSDDGGNNWLAVRRHGMFYFFFLLESPFSFMALCSWPGHFFRAVNRWATFFLCTFEREQILVIESIRCVLTLLVLKEYFGRYRKNPVVWLNQVKGRVYVSTECGGTITRWNGFIIVLEGRLTSAAAAAKRKRRKIWILPDNKCFMNSKWGKVEGGKLRPPCQRVVETTYFRFVIVPWVK